MTISMYNASVPVFKQMLTALSEVLAKAEAHVAEKNIEPNALLQARLFPDMFPLVRQVQIAADFTKARPRAWPAWTYRRGPTPKSRSPTCKHSLPRRWTTSVHSTPRNSKVARTRKSSCARVRRKRRELGGSAYLQHYGLPQFFFHVTTAYAILRHNGVNLGKRDYMGAQTDSTNPVQTRRGG